MVDCLSLLPLTPLLQCLSASIRVMCCLRSVHEIKNSQGKYWPTVELSKCQIAEFCYFHNETSAHGALSADNVASLSAPVEMKSGWRSAPEDCEQRSFDVWKPTIFPRFHRADACPGCATRCQCPSSSIEYLPVSWREEEISFEVVGSQLEPRRWYWWFCEVLYCTWNATTPLFAPTRTNKYICRHMQGGCPCVLTLTILDKACRA